MSSTWTFTEDRRLLSRLIANVPAAGWIGSDKIIVHGVGPLDIYMTGAQSLDNR